MPAEPLRRSRSIAAGLVLLAAAGGAGWYAWNWEPRSYVPSDVAYWYRMQWKPGRLHPGWSLLSVGRDAQRPQFLVHRVQVPSPLAGDLVMMGASERGRVVAEVACPDAEHPIWEKLRRRHDVRIELQTERGAFAAVDCRAEVF